MRNMIPTHKPRRILLPFLFLTAALFFVIFAIKDPIRAAGSATSAFNALVTVATALMTFVSNLG
ncbi:hypothetical protein [Nonomuraea sp. NPDC046570]|uniref:hypothetical protein n=1 Tax=Nonomuraea sp. NPDC046570 TaxID=3155255 RepID=UPI0033EC383F